MPIVAGVGVSYSPLLYRERDQWAALSQILRGDAIQPKSAESENETVLDDYAQRISAGFQALKLAITSAKLDALIILSADRGSQFDSSHIPQIHVQVGGEVWGDPAISALEESSQRRSFSCEEQVSAMVIEELVRSGFDVAEAKGTFRPVGNPDVGFNPAAVEAATRLAHDVPIIPITLNCHIAPMIKGARLYRLGVALSEITEISDRRIGILVSGGLSGDSRGSMSGWVDSVFDKWVLTRIERGKPEDLASVWNVPSRNLLTATTEVRLWTVAAAALHRSGCRASIHDYMPIHHAAAGVGFVSWEKN